MFDSYRVVLQKRRLVLMSWKVLPAKAGSCLLPSQLSSKFWDTFSTPLCRARAFFLSQQLGRGRGREILQLQGNFMFPRALLDARHLRDRSVLPLDCEKEYKPTQRHGKELW